MKRATMDEVLEQEQLSMGRPIGLRGTRELQVTDADGPHQVLLVVYDASSDEHWQTRYALTIDGVTRVSGIVANGTRRLFKGERDHG